MLGMIGMFVAILVLIFGAFKRVNIFLMTLISVFIVILTSGLPLWDTYAVTYVTAFSGPYKNFLLMFLASCLYSKVLELSGSATKIAYTIVNALGKEKVFTAACVAGSLLAYGGVSGFALSFIMVPIMYGMFSKANIHRKYMYCVIHVSCGTWVAGFLPYSASVSNVMPATAFGVSLGAAPILGLGTSVACLVFQLWYLNGQIKKDQKLGNNFEFGPSVNPDTYKDVDPAELPSVFAAFIPMIGMIASIIIGSQFGINGTKLTIISLLAAALVSYLLNIKKMNEKKPNEWITAAALQAVGTLTGLAAVTGFAAVLAQTTAYNSVLTGLIASTMHPYIKAALASFLVAFVAGSSTAAVGIIPATPVLMDYFFSCGANLAVISRTVSMFSMMGSSFPNCAGNYVHLSVVELTQADCYPKIFIINFVGPMIISAIALAICIVAA